MNQLWNSFKIAFSMYSRIPVPGSEWTKEHMKYTLCFFPAVGAIVGLLVICWSDFSRFLDFGMPARTAGLTLIPVIVTGGIHMDGFMDTADALGSFRGREKKLLILKDPHCGAFAVLSCVCYFLAYGGAVSEIGRGNLLILAWGFVLSRALSAFSIASFPMAKETGLAASFSGAAHKSGARSLGCDGGRFCGRHVLPESCRRTFVHRRSRFILRLVLPDLDEAVWGHHRGSRRVVSADM